MSDAAGIVRDVLASAKAPCITSSFQAEDVVVVHMVRQIRPDVPVLFLETFHHFAETLKYRDELASAWGLKLVNLQAPEAKIGLWRTDTQACCALHKVGPLFGALEAYGEWFTGLRREQSPSRAALEEIEQFRLPSGRFITKVSPLARWTMREVWSYAKAHAIPLLPLYEVGYSSIGCEPCTSLPPDPLNPRSGRWEGKKLECGIHIQPVEKSS